MTVRREMSGTETFTYTQAWTIDNRLASVTKTDLTGTVLAVTTYAFDGDGARVRKDDPDGTTLYAGVMEHIIGAPGTAMAEYFDDASGPTMSAYVTTRSEPVVAGLQGSYTTTPPLPTMGDAPWAIRWQLWLTVPVTDTYTFAVQADDGFSLSGIGPALTNTTTRALTTTEASSGVVLTPGLIYNFSLAYMNYTTATTSTIQLLWRRAGGALEIVPREAIHARGRRDYYSFGGAVVAMKDGVMASVTRTLSYLHGDHLGSASLTTNASGQKVSEQRYKPYGEVRWASGAGIPTDKQFTGQTRLAEGYVGTLYDYVARAYDPVLGRFISADTIVPGAGNPQAFNRYSYALNSPLRYADPSGHRACNDSDDCEPAGGRTDWPPPPPPQPVGAGAFVLVLAIGSTGVAAGPSILLWGAAGVLATGVMVYEAVTSDATLAFPPYPLPATEPGAIGPTYPPGGSSTLQVDNTPLPYGGLDSLNSDPLFPNLLPKPLAPLPWMPAKGNPHDDDAEKIGRINGLRTEEELSDWGRYIEDQKRLGDRGALNDRGDFKWGQLVDLIKEYLEQRGN